MTAAAARGGEEEARGGENEAGSGGDYGAQEWIGSF
jgi:hypothetical protein